MKGVSNPFFILFWIVDGWFFASPERMVWGEDVPVFIVDVAVFVDIVGSNGVVDV